MNKIKKVFLTFCLSLAMITGVIGTSNFISQIYALSNSDESLIQPYWVDDTYYYSPADYPFDSKVYARVLISINRTTSGVTSAKIKSFEICIDGHAEKSSSRISPAVGSTVKSGQCIIVYATLKYKGESSNYSFLIYPSF